MRAIAIDADGTDYYDDNKDFIPAINYAIDYTLSVMDYAYGQNKISEEVYRELTKVIVYQLNEFSRFTPSSEVRTIIAVAPEPEVFPTTWQLNATSNSFESFERTDIYYVKESSKGMANRMSVEAINKSAQNPFSKGSPLAKCLVEYSYINPINYNKVSPVTKDFEIEIRPAIPKRLVGVFYCKQHPILTATTGVNGTILLNEKLRIFLCEKALSYVTRKQADGITINQVTEKELGTLLQLLRV